MTHRTKQPTISIFVVAVALIAAMVILPPPVSAQAADSGPALGVARVSLVNGEVTSKRGDSGDWVAARINQAVVEGDSIMTGPGSRAEVQLDHGNLVRLDGNSEIEFSSLGNRKFQIRVIRGSIGYSELRGSDADVDIETPHVALRPMKNGRYRIEMGPAETVVTVRKGEAEIASVNGAETLRSGRMMIVRDGPEGPEFRVSGADPKDEWDRWAESRDNRLSKSKSYKYVSSDIYGAESLDEHGDWRHVSGYGYSWFPRASTGWAPYRQGNWSWIDYYGWNWVGAEPWGWAPYHWGRWYHHASHGWGWYPGSMYRRHQWRPALVSFFGYNSRSGFNFGLGLGYGNIGWLPLGPGEAYNPWYGGGYYGGGRRGGRGNQTIIVDNSVNIYNNYRNARAPNGVTVVDAQGFSQGLVNNPRTLRGAELARATSIRGKIPVVPARGAQGRIVRASTGSAGGVRTASGGTSTRSLRNGTARIPFDRQRTQMESSVRTFRGSTQGRTTTATTGRAAPSNARAGTGTRGATATAGTRSGIRVTSTSGTRSTAGTAGTRTAARTITPAGTTASTRASTRNSGWRQVGSTSTGTSSRTGTGGVTVQGTTTPRSGQARANADTWSRFGGRSTPSGARSTGTRTTSSRTTGSRSTSGQGAITRSGQGRLGNPQTGRSNQRPTFTPRTQSRSATTRGSSAGRTRTATSSGTRGTAGPRSRSNTSIYTPRTQSRVGTSSTASRSRSRTSNVPRSSGSQSRSRSVYTPQRRSAPSSRGGGFPSTRSSAPSRSSSGRSSGGGGSVGARSAPSRAPAAAPRSSGGATRSSGGGTRSRGGR